MRRLAALALFLGLSISLVAATVPRPTPEFVINHPGGKQTLLSMYKGKVIALMFIFTTCPHCQATCQAMSRLYTELGSKGFQPLAVAVNPMAQMLVSDFIRDNKVNFPVGASERDPALQYLGINAVERWVVPQVVLIDKKGVIQKQTPPLGDEKLQEENSLRQQILELLGGAKTTSKQTPSTKKPS
ncbi:MAG: TlpA family protein disulfide reductase [Acidobacteria bacterium]|nr:TlpA family protein disulfide reductase [Acidobacteriota bacterium]